MKRFSLSVFMIFAMLMLAINFTGCKKLSKDVLQANGHLTKANEFYEKDNFKAAVKEYEEALKKNPDLKKKNLELYIAACYSSLYKSNIQPPENQELLQKIKESAFLVSDLRTKLLSSAEDAIAIKEKLDAFKKLVVENVGQSEGMLSINDYINDSANGLSGVNDIVSKIISKEKEIYAITSTVSPIVPEYRAKIEENIFNKLKIKELKDYIDSNSDAEDLEAKRTEIDNLNKKIIDNEIVIEKKYVKNKAFYKKMKENVDLKREIQAGKEYFNAIVKTDIPEDKDEKGHIVKYEDMYDYLVRKTMAIKNLESENREIREYFTKKDDIENKKEKLETMDQALSSKEGYKEVKVMVDKIKADKEQIKNLKLAVIDLVEKKDDAEGSLITEYSEKYDVFSEKLLEDIDNNKKVAELHDYLKTVKGYEVVLQKINSDRNYLKSDEKVKAERLIISANNKFLDNVKNLEEIKIKLKELAKYSKLLKESEQFLASVKNLDNIIAKYKSNEVLKQELAKEKSQMNESEIKDVLGTLSRFGSFEYDNVSKLEATKVSKSNKRKIVLTGREKELTDKIAINNKYFSKIKNYNKIIETYNHIDNYKKTVKKNEAYLSKVDKINDIKLKLIANERSVLNIEKIITSKKNIASNYLKKLKNSKLVVQKFSKIVDLNDSLLQNKMFYEVSEGFEVFKTKFDKMMAYQEDINKSGLTQEKLKKEIENNEKIISDNETYKELSVSIKKRSNLEYRLKADETYIAKIEKKYKKGNELESKFDEVILKFTETQKIINTAKATFKELNAKYPEILKKFKLQESRIKAENSNENYLKKAVRNEKYKNSSIQHLTDYINTESNDKQDRRKALTLLSDMYKKIAQSAPDETTKELFFQKTKTCYDELLKDAGNDKKKTVLALYNKAKFYAEFGKNKIAKEQYFKRIALDPYAPDGYYYFANYLQTNALYDEAIANHKKRIYALIDMLNGNHNIIDAVVKIDSMRTTMAKLKNKEVYVERTAKLLKLLDATSKQEFYAKKKEIEAIKKQNQDNINAFREVLQASYVAYKKLDVKAMDKKLKNKLAKAYYTLGVVYWTSSYSTDPTQMAANYRLSILNSGFRVLDESIRLDPLFPEPWSYKALLWFQMKKVNPEKVAEYMAKNKENNNVFKRLIKKRADMKRFEDAQKNV